MDLMNMVLPSEANPKQCACYGFYQEQGSALQEVELIPAYINYDIHIANALANVDVSQKFNNHTQKFLELEYSFCISKQACLHRFAAVFANRRMEGVVKEKELAQKEFHEAVRQGKQAALGEVDA